jgi:hypothetical protein
MPGDKTNIPFDERQNLHYDPAYDKFNGRLKISDYLLWGCQKSVPLFEGFFLQPLISAFRISDNIFEKRYRSGLQHRIRSVENLEFF